MPNIEWTKNIFNVRVKCNFYIDKPKRSKLGSVDNMLWSCPNTYKKERNLHSNFYRCNLSIMKLQIEQIREKLKHQ